MLRLLITSGFAREKCLIRTYPITESSGEKPADAKHVHRSANGPVAETVFARPKLPWPMIDRDFNQSITRAPDKGGNETVHSFERNEGGNTFALHRFHAAPGIADAITGETAPDKIRDPARGAFHGRVFSIGAITANEIGLRNR